MSNNLLTKFKNGDIVYDISYKHLSYVTRVRKDWSTIELRSVKDGLLYIIIENPYYLLKITDNELLEMLYGRS